MDSETESTFLITHAEPDTAVLTDVHSGQVHTLSDNPGVEEDDGWPERSHPNRRWN